MIENSFYEFISGHASITALVGTNVYRQRAPSTTALPFIILTNTDTESTGHMTGATNRAVANFTVSVWSADYDNATAILEAVRRAVHGKQGTIGSANQKVTRMFCPRYRDALIDPDDGADAPLYSREVEVTVQFEENAPTG